MPRPGRTIAAVLAELAEVRHHLHEAPPHHDGGRDALELRLAQLETELCALRAVALPRAGGREPSATSEGPETDPPQDAPARS